jgi:hypothetical protein
VSDVRHVHDVTKMKNGLERPRTAYARTTQCQKEEFIHFDVLASIHAVAWLRYPLAVVAAWLIRLGQKYYVATDDIESCRYLNSLPETSESEHVLLPLPTPACPPSGPRINDVDLTTVRKTAKF